MSVEIKSFAKLKNEKERKDWSKRSLILGNARISNNEDYKLTKCKCGQTKFKYQEICSKCYGTN